MGSSVLGHGLGCMQKYAFLVQLLPHLMHLGFCVLVDMLASRQRPDPAQARFAKY